MSTRDLDAFLRNVKANPFGYSPEILAIADEAEEKKIFPCKICTMRDPRTCTDKNCVAWFKWFQRSWKSIRKQAGK